MTFIFGTCTFDQLSFIWGEGIINICQRKFPEYLIDKVPMQGISEFNLLHVYLCCLFFYYNTLKRLSPCDLTNCGHSGLWYDRYTGKNKLKISTISANITVMPFIRNDTEDVKILYCKIQVQVWYASFFYSRLTRWELICCDHAMINYQHQMLIFYCQEVCFNSDKYWAKVTQNLLILWLCIIHI